MSFLSDDEEDFCPLCLEPMDITDKNFKPCPCGYQICQFCYNNIRQNEELNGRCPACRRKYDDESVEYVILSPEELKMEREKQARKEWERKQRDKERKENEYANRKHLAGMRVIQKNLVYVVGINPPVPYEEVASLLKSDKYFGQYGKINKIVVNRKTPHSNANDHYHANNANNIVPGYGVYITFSKKEDAAKCIAQVDGTYMDGRLVKAAYGTTKYCSSYLRGLPCPNPNCMFLHEPGEEADSFNRRELSNKQQASQMHQSLSQQARPHVNNAIFKNSTTSTTTATVSGSGHISGTPSPAPVKLQLHHDGHQNGTGSSTPVLTPAPVPTGSNPWGVTQSATPITSINLSKNSSSHNLPSLSSALHNNHPHTEQTTAAGHKKKQNHNTHDKEFVDPYDALSSAVRFLDSRINALSHYKTQNIQLKADLVDQETYDSFPSLFSWSNIEPSEESSGELTKKLVDILAINPVDHSASVVSFLQNASASANNDPNARTPLPQNILPQQSQGASQAPQHRPLNVSTPPPPGMFAAQHIALQQQQQHQHQHQHQRQQQDNGGSNNSTDFLNQLINGRRVAASN